MDEEPDGPVTLNFAGQFPYAAIAVPWSAILSA
jgi:hypothetical protein